MLLAAPLALCLYAAFADGAIDLPQESWVQLGLVAIAALALAVALYGNGPRPAASRTAWIGLALLGAFAAWSGLSIAWSVAPDRSWLELNRALAYVLAVAVGITAGSAVPAAHRRTAIGLALVAAPVALYALGGKTLPGLPGLDHAGGLTRLREPLGYWNALALVCALAVAPALRLAADPEGRGRTRLGALGLLTVLLVVVGLTYSRGGFVAVAVAVGVFLALTTERMRALVLFGVASVGSVVPLAFALGSAELTTNGLPLDRREDDALVVFVVLVISLAAVVWAGRAVMRLERSPRFTPARGRRAGRIVLAAAGGLAGLALVGALAGGAVADGIDRFTDTRRGDRLTDPNRLLSAQSGNRWTWWREAAGAWSDEPVRGWGAGSFPVTHRLYRRDALNVQQPHSVPLQWLAETGAVGLALAAGGLLALLAAALARTRALRGRERGYAAALIALPAAWLVHCLVDWDWDIPAVTLPMLLALGVAVARPGAVPSRGGPAGARGGLLAVGVVALVLCGVSAGLPALAETRIAAALQAVGEEGVSDATLADAAADAELAAKLNPLAVEPLFAAASVAERRGRLDDARRELLRAVERQPDSVEAWYRLARVEGVRRDAEGVLRATGRALELDPRSPGAIGLARAARANAAPADGSATATGTPLLGAP